MALAEVAMIVYLVCNISLFSKISLHVWDLGHIMKQCPIKNHS